MFNENKYTNWYFNIIKNATLRATTKSEAKNILGYVERHHVIPKCMGGDNSASNLTYLSAREHFLCHLLLLRMVDNNVILQKLRYAVYGFQKKNRQQHRILTSWEFAKLREIGSLAISLSKRGKKQGERSRSWRENLSKARRGKASPLKGTTLPKDSPIRTKISQRLKGRVSPTKGMKFPLAPDDPRRQQISARRKGVPTRTGIPCSEETALKISAANKGKVAWNKGVATPTIDCPHCGQSIGGQSNYNRWHGENCRRKTI